MPPPKKIKSNKDFQKQFEKLEKDGKTRPSSEEEFNIVLKKTVSTNPQKIVNKDSAKPRKK